jgi:hypothetical protein
MGGQMPAFFKALSAKGAKERKEMRARAGAGRFVLLVSFVFLRALRG